MLIAVPMQVLGWRAGQVGLEQADYVLTTLSLPAMSRVRVTGVWQ
ncbi:hypothetical protein [Streptomyces subrutilus]